MRNMNLCRAKSMRNDEFYTRYSDVAFGISAISRHLCGRSVLCNCDRPDTSAFWKYLHQNFTALGLSKLAAVYYDTKEPVYLTEYAGGDDIDVMSGTKTALMENGDFRNEENIRILEKYDVVITNPPFSLFGEYVNQLCDFGKQFFVIGSINAATRRDIFRRIRMDEVWFGSRFHKDTAYFDIPIDADVSMYSKGVYDAARHQIKMGNCIWYTNIKSDEYKSNLKLVKKYTPEAYPKYENYDAIDVSKVVNIPYDYTGKMAVPVTYLKYYDSNEFEILGMSAVADEMDEPVKLGSEFMKAYRSQGGTAKFSEGMYGIYYYDNDGKVHVPYRRIIIRRR